MSAMRRLLIFCLMSLSLRRTAAEDAVSNHPALVSSHVTLSCNEQGVLRYILTAAKVISYHNGDQAYSQGLQITLYGPDQEAWVQLSAQFADFIAAEAMYVLRGDVRLQDLRDNRQLYTKVLHWNLATATCYTDQPVRVVIGDKVFIADGFTAKQDLSAYRLFKRPKTP